MAELGRLGTWSSMRQWPADPAAIADAARGLERAGYATAWIGGGPGGSADHLDLVDSILSATTTLVVATAVIEVWSSPAVDVANRHRILTERFPGRFLLGLGAGHAEAVEPTTGLTYTKPLAKLDAYLDELDGGAAPVPPSGRILAALGPRMLELAARRSLGAHTFEVTPEHTAAARARIGPEPLLVPEQKVVLESDPAAARAIARSALALHLLLPNYLTSWKRLGFEDDDFTDGGSNRLVDTLVGWGSPEAVADRVRAQLDAGASHVAVNVLEAAESGLPQRGWAEAAEYLQR